MDSYTFLFFIVLVSVPTWIIFLRYWLPRQKKERDEIATKNMNYQAVYYSHDRSYANELWVLYFIVLLYSFAFQLIFPDVNISFMFSFLWLLFIVGQSLSLLGFIHNTTLTRTRSASLLLIKLFFEGMVIVSMIFLPLFVLFYYEEHPEKVIYYNSCLIAVSFFILRARFSFSISVVYFYDDEILIIKGWLFNNRERYKNKYLFCEKLVCCVNRYHVLRYKLTDKRSDELIGWLDFGLTVKHVNWLDYDCGIKEEDKPIINYLDRLQSSQ